PWLTLLNDSEGRVETAQEVVGLFDRRYVGVAHAQIDGQFLSQAPVILNEAPEILPGQLAGRGAHKKITSRRLSAEKVFERAGYCVFLAIREYSDLAALEINPAPGVMEVGI